MSSHGGWDDQSVGPKLRASNLCICMLENDRSGDPGGDLFRRYRLRRTRLTWITYAGSATVRSVTYIDGNRLVQWLREQPSDLDSDGREAVQRWLREHERRFQG